MNMFRQAGLAAEEALRSRIWSVGSGWMPDAAAAAVRNADVVVIGGGIIGVAAAYSLARRGASVVLLEARGLGAGASGRNAGLFLPGAAAIEDPSIVDATLEAEALDVDMEKCGHLALAGRAEVWRDFAREQVARPPSAPKIDLLDRSACEELAQSRLPPYILGGRWYPGGRSVNPWKLLLGLAERAAGLGCSIVVPCRAERLTLDGDGVIVHCRRGAIRAGHVLLACGSRTGDLISTIEDPPRAHPAQMQALAAGIEADPPPGLALDFGRVYWRRLRDGHVIVGGLAELDRQTVAPGDEDVNVSAQEALARHLADMVPDWQLGPPAHRWAAVFDESPDGRPVIGPLDGAEKIWLACGFGGHGLPLALGVGAAVTAGMGFGEAGAPAAPSSYAAGRLRWKLN